jgi:fructosamine-3-kinase
MTALADRVAQLTGTQVSDLRLIGRQHLWQHYRGSLAGGREIFVKHTERWPPDPLSSEADGLHWIAEANAVPTPDVLGCDRGTLVLSWVPPSSPTPTAAERFGRALAHLHTAGAHFPQPATYTPSTTTFTPSASSTLSASSTPSPPPASEPAFGAPWPGFIASLPLDNTLVTGSDAWPQWYAARRLLPFLRRAADAGTLGRDGIRAVESVIGRIGELAGPAEPPSRIHGDCWSGNVLWSAGQGWLIDPAAHGGHRETDLAMLALFGAPHLDRILAAYTETSPLAEGWRSRVPLHQLHPLLVHVCLFGASYASSVRDAAEQALSA